VAAGVSSYSADFAQFGEHDDDVAVVLPQHSPEVLRRLGPRSLRRDVRPPEPITLHADSHALICPRFLISSEIKVKGKVGRAPPERRRGAHLPFKAIEPVGG